MMFEWFKKPNLRARVLDELLDDIADTTDREHREQLWAELCRRFIQDVERACRVVSGAGSQERAQQILDQAIRTIGSDAPAFFTRELVRIMRRELGTVAVELVIRSIYVRQFVTLLPLKLTRYLEAFLDNESQFDWTAERLNEPIETVKARVGEAWRALEKVVRRTYSAAEVAERTEGYWTHEAFTGDVWK